MLWLLNMHLDSQIWQFWRQRKIFPKTISCLLLKSTCDVNLLSKLSIIFKEWRVMNNVDSYCSLCTLDTMHKLFFVTRLIINKIIQVQWVNFKLENVLVSLHSLKTMGLAPFGASAPLFLRNGELLGHSPIRNGRNFFKWKNTGQCFLKRCTVSIKVVNILVIYII